MVLPDDDAAEEAPTAKLSSVPEQPTGGVNEYLSSATDYFMSAAAVAQ